MAKGDGWAVKRYVCPKCLRKGFYLQHFIYSNRMECMYKNCNYQAFANDAKVLEVNPELKNNPPKYKPNQLT